MSNTPIYTSKSSAVQGFVTIQEQDTQFNAQVPLPGFPKEGVIVLLDGNTLKVRATRTISVPNSDLNTPSTDKEINGSAYLWIPTTVNKELITATYSDGLLQITMPKKEEFILKTRSIEIL